MIFSEQSSIIIKSLTKLPKEFDMVTYPSLVTIIHKNPTARDIIRKDFDVTVRNLILITLSCAFSNK